MRIFSSMYANMVTLSLYIHRGIYVFDVNYTKILEANLFAFAYRLFHEDFSPINGVLQMQTN